MFHLRCLVGILGAMVVAGVASAEEAPVKSVQNKADVVTEQCNPYTGLPMGSSPQPGPGYSHEPTCFGRAFNWLMYRPLCANTPCEAECVSKRNPTLISYFTCSPYYRCHRPFDCGSCNTPWYCGWFCGRAKHCKRDDVCRTKCRPKSPLFVSVTLPSISFNRGCDECPAPADACCDKPCNTKPCCETNGDQQCTDCCDTCTPGKERRTILPRPVIARKCEAACPVDESDKNCETCPPVVDRRAILPRPIFSKKCDSYCPTTHGGPGSETGEITAERRTILPRSLFGKKCEETCVACPSGPDTATCDSVCRSRVFQGRLLGFRTTGCGVGGCDKLGCDEAGAASDDVVIESRCGTGSRLLGYLRTSCGLGGCGSCGYGKKLCHHPVDSSVDLEHLPILSPQNIQNREPGSLRKYAESIATRPASYQASPAPMMTPLPPPAPLPMPGPTVAPPPAK